MTFDPAQHQREQCLLLVAAGTGWDAYVLDKAARLEKEPEHAGLVKVVEAEIGNQRTAAARAALAWFRRNP